MIKQSTLFILFILSLLFNEITSIHIRIEVHTIWYNAVIWFDIYMHKNIHLKLKDATDRIEVSIGIACNEFAN